MTSDKTRLAAINPAIVKYVKLGRGGKWEDVALKRGEIHFGYKAIPHGLAKRGDLKEIARRYRAEGRSRGTATRFANELLEFYTLEQDCLWITFAKGYLWWAFSKSAVKWLGGDGKKHGERMRRTIGGWRNTDINGHPLRQEALSTKLTQVAAFRGTLCTVKERDYVVNRINDVVEKRVRKARKAQSVLIAAARNLIAALHWADFELMVDLVFARSGWQRVTAVGGSAQADTDLILANAATEERACVQVKSTATQKDLNDYVGRVRGRFDRAFFVCHSPRADFKAAVEDKVHVWTNDTLASAVIRVGLYDWLIEKTS